MGDFPFAVQVWLSVIRNWAGRHHAGRCCSTGLGSCCSLGMNTLCFLFECASSQWKKVPGRLCTSQGFTGREERQVQSQRPPAPGSPGLPFAGGPGIVSAASAARGGRDRGAESSLCWWGSQPTHSLIKGPCVGGLWGSRGPPYSFDSWSSGSPRGQPRAARDAWWVAGPGLSGILLSPYLGCHFSAIPQNWLTHLPCTGRVGGCGCAGVLACGPEPFSPLSASLCVQEADPSVFQPLLPHWLVSNLHQPMGSTGRRLEGERRTGRAGMFLACLSRIWNLRSNSVTFFCDNSYPWNNSPLLHWVPPFPSAWSGLDVSVSIVCTPSVPQHLKVPLILSHPFMANRWGNSGNSVRFYFGGLQNHCRWWLQPWNQKTLTPWKKSYDQPR